MKEFKVFNRFFFIYSLNISKKFKIKLLIFKNTNYIHEQNVSELNYVFSKKYIYIQYTYLNI